MVTAVDYEIALLGAVLRGYPDVPSLTRIVTAADFYQPAHEQIWQAAVAVHSSGQKPDPLTVRAQMGNAANALPSGPLYLADLDAPVTAQAPFYAAKVREQAIRRQVEDLGNRCRQLIEDVDTSPEDLVAKIRVWADAIGSRSASRRSITDALEQVIDIAQHGEAKATPTPWANLNELVPGWYPGQLITFGARPGVGKTIALENVATDVARTGKHVAFVSLEMRDTELLQRTLAHTAKVPLSRLRNGTCEENDWAKIMGAKPTIEATPIRIYDQPNQTVNDIRAAAWETSQEAKRAESELGLVVIDYVQLIRPIKSSSQESRQQQVGAITRALKQLAKELDTPVVTAAQLNRQGQNRSQPLPMLSDLREAGDIEQDSDVVIFLHEQEVEDGGRTVKTGDIDLIVAKQRSGPTGTRTIRKHGHYARLSDQ